MSAPKHLWSGEWEQESAAAARERARQATSAPVTDQPPVIDEPPVTAPRAVHHEPRDAGQAPRTPPGQRAAELLAALRLRLVALVAELRRRAAGIRRPSRPALLAGALVAVLVIVVAFVAGALSGSGSNSPSGSGPYLGVQLEELPVDQVLISAIVPGSPADKAGLDPGDLIVAIDNHPVAVPGDVTNLISSMHPGEQVQIQFQRGPDTLTTQVTLTAQGSSP